MKLGIQMYAIRSLCEKDLEAGLRTVAEIGYQGVEFAGFFGHSADEVAGWLKKYGLEAMGAHISAGELFDHIDETIAFHKTIGNRRLICPWYDLHTKADVEALAAKMIAIAPKVREAGMKLYYHNHAHEFEMDDGVCLIDLLAQAVPADVLSLEFDVYWVTIGKQDPVSYLKTYKDRIDIFHAKDGTAEGGTLAGCGMVDLPAVTAYAKEIGMEWAVVESEASDEMLSQIISITKDYAYTRPLL